ncbi:MAG TPA: hypothetical protein VFR92_05365, partial [Sphingomicrobium sp.]|nr:hypothetical protein [Sphingomicrobium sp.]
MVPSTVVPSLIVTLLFASAVPFSVGVVSSVVAPLFTLPCDAPTLSVALVIVGVTIATSFTLVSPVPVAVLPAVSAIATEAVIVPSARP